MFTGLTELGRAIWRISKKRGDATGTDGLSEPLLSHVTIDL